MSILLFYSLVLQTVAAVELKEQHALQQKEEKLLAGLLPYGWLPVQEDKWISLITSAYFSWPSWDSQLQLVAELSILCFFSPTGTVQDFWIGPFGRCWFCTVRVWRPPSKWRHGCPIQNCSLQHLQQLSLSHRTQQCLPSLPSNRA